MLFINGDVPTAMIISLHLLVQFLFNYWTTNANSNNKSRPDIVILSNNKEDFNNNNEENNNIYVSIPEVVQPKNLKTIVTFKMSDKNETTSQNNENEDKSVLKQTKKKSVDKFDNQPFAPIHLKSIEDMPDIAISTVFGTSSSEKRDATTKKKDKYGEGARPVVVRFAESVEADVEKKDNDNFFHKTGRTADSGVVLNDVEAKVLRVHNGAVFNPGFIKKERRESIKKDRSNISYHLELFNDGDLVPETQQLLSKPLSPRPVRKISSPLVLKGRSNLYEGRVHKVSNPLVAPHFQPSIQIDNYDTGSPPHPPSSPIFTEIPQKIFDTPFSLNTNALQRDVRSASPKATFNAQQTWYDLFDRIRRHEDLTLPPTRQTRSFESLHAAQMQSSTYNPQTLTPGGRIRKISSPNPPTQPMMKSIDISNLGCNDDLILETERRWTMSHDALYSPPLISSSASSKKEEQTFEDIKQRSRKISRTRKTSILDGTSPTVVYKTIYAFRSANNAETQCKCNVIVVDFDTFNEREIDVLEIKSKYICFYLNDRMSVCPWLNVSKKLECITQVCHKFHVINRIFGVIYESS